MDREILFRGQTRKRGEKVRMDGTPVDGNWVYGGIFPGEGDFSVIYSAHPVEKHVVHADTVGQYTGLNDKHGVRIFEGDVIQVGDDIYTFVVEFGKCGGTRNCKDFGYLGFYLRPHNDETRRCARFGLRDDICYWLTEYRLEIIGNIHDNPEMMERKGKTHERS